ncbi:extracellular solute-binding protein [Desulfopila aestuarii]|uniref:Microcin C transport system substrate-binding protein n=1 Tax=Desulfopila aestuarii DSM 18488 TaxID=1121416 RepID=A0A1M7YCA1_9BACT|nr:extracellular solute-binding protein [Desulfopila aestuarii]SHO50138.1 microcin C transport system substrate-binding protein [Desulfopila aestuarii DSM 18488]
MRYLVAISSVLICIAMGVPSPSWGAHGLSMNGALKYPADFQQFSYSSPLAKVGGKLVLHDIGGFDKMNPFTLKGQEPYGLETFVFDPLAVASLDEPFSEYGLIAKDIAVAEDKMSMTFTLHPDARFSDGTPVTVEDVAYSLATLKGPTVHPFYPYYYRDISGSEIVDATRIRFLFSKANRELPMIACQIPIFSKNSFPGDAGEAEFLTPPIGSGPYVVDKVEQGRAITYKRNPEYWARNHPTRKGMFNYDTITVKYYKDQVVAVEAFKAGEFDVLSVNIAKQWARDLEGPRFESKELVKKLFPHHNNAGMQGFLMNTRKPMFQDKKVRKAIGLALDFEWTNNALFYGQYTRSESFFSNSYLAATGLPEGLELEYLSTYKNELPPEVFTTPLKAPVTDGTAGLRKNLREAMALLKDAGYSIKDGVLVNKNGEPFAFEIILVNPSFERVMAAYVGNLEKLGMKVSYRTIDSTLYTERLKSFDFDMIVAAYGQSQSPGNEQRNFWHSEAADQPGSNNYAGIKSKAVDYLIDKIIYAGNQEELVAASRALDRVLWYGYYLVPNWYMSGHRIAYHNKFSMPEVLPDYYAPLQLIMTWWLK